MANTAKLYLNKNIYLCYYLSDTINIFVLAEQLLVHQLSKLPNNPFTIQRPKDKINNYMKQLKNTLLVLLAMLAIGTLQAQEEPEMNKSEKQEKSARPKDMLEFGLRGNYMFLGGDVTPEAGFGGGLHFRKALDYIFSLRLDGVYGKMQGDNGINNILQNREFESTYLAGTLMGVMSLNNFRFDRPKKQKGMNLYILVGAGANTYETKFNGIPEGLTRNAVIDKEVAPHVAAGAGVSFRLGSGVNIGLEYIGQMLLGDRSDRLDGYANDGNFRDVVNAASLTLNFNLGSKSQRSEPLYWVNPFDPIANELGKMNQRIDDAFLDSDNDGIPDAIDLEPNTPANVPVDTRGRTLDSDKDGIPDFRDLEPFFPPRPGEEVDANGVIINRIDKAVTEERVQEMIDEAIAKARLNSTTSVSGDMRELFIPMIYFPLNQHTVKYSDYGTLASIAQVLNGNPGMRLVVRGFTDKVGDRAANDRLSYLRAKAVIDHLVNQQGISRSRLVLQWRGEDENIVPQNQTYLNRRVEFQTAGPGEYEQDPPAGVNSGSGGY